MKTKSDRNGHPSDRESLIIELSGVVQNWPGRARKVSPTLSILQILLLGVSRIQRENRPYWLSVHETRHRNWRF